MKKILLILALAVTLACNAALGTPTAMPTARPTVTAALVQTTTAAHTETITAIAPTETQPAKQLGFVEVRLHPFNGELPGQLATQAEKALEQGLLPAVEFDATW